MESGVPPQRHSGMRPGLHERPRPSGAEEQGAGPAVELSGAWAELPLAWPGLSEAPSFVFRGGGLSLSAWGEALRLRGASALGRAAGSRVSFRSAPPVAVPGPFVASLPFAPGASLGRAWEGFSAPAAFAPELIAFELDGRAPRAFLVALAEAAAGPGAAEARLESALSRVRGGSGDGSRGAAPLEGVERPEGFARERFTALVEEALREIGRGELQKVVVARALEVELSRPPAPRELCEALARRFPTCRVFWLQGRGAVFAGASPETLAVIEGRQLRCDALAGTAAPGHPLLGLDKELREHAAVVDGLRAALIPLAESIEAADGPRVLKLANVDHLHTELRARLRASAGVAEVAAALHPSSAVAGAPRAAALRFLERREGLERGLYAGLVGLVGPDRSELHVALRSALLRGRSARLFVGAGIVRGSVPADEWGETQLKAQALLGALGASR